MTIDLILPLQKACARVHLAANEAIAACARGDLVAASDASEKAEDRFDVVRAVAKHSFGAMPDEQIDEACEIFMETRLAMRNAVARVRAAVTGSFRAGAS